MCQPSYYIHFKPIFTVKFDDCYCYILFLYITLMKDFILVHGIVWLDSSRTMIGHCANLHIITNGWNKATVYTV